jgi:Uncharacterized conserved protein
MHTLDKIKLEISIKGTIDKIWRYFTEEEHILNWYFASDEWHCPFANNDLRVGGKFNFRMEAKDKSMGFNFEGEYLKVIPQEEIEYILADGRMVNILFDPDESNVRIIEIFDPEEVNPIDMQRAGWYSILKNFKLYAEEGEL